MCFIRERNMRRRANHAMIAIILIDFLKIMCDLVPISLSYFYTGHVRSLSICLYWATENYTLQAISSWLMAIDIFPSFSTTFGIQFVDMIFRS
jgi:hypothetical protein